MISPKAARDRKRKPVPIPVPPQPKPTGQAYKLKQPAFGDFSGWDENTDVSSFGMNALYTRATAGKSYVDPTFSWYREQASKNGLCFGAFHYFEINDVQKQIDNFLRVALGCQWLILDAEYDPGPWPLGLRGEALANQYKAFLDGVEQRTGFLPWIYTNLKSWAFTVYDPTGKKDRRNYQYPLWSSKYPVIVAWYPNQPDAWSYPAETMVPSCFKDVRGWQYQDNGRSCGLPFNDVNVWLK